jgi:hypothetical protein
LDFTYFLLDSTKFLQARRFFAKLHGRRNARLRVAKSPSEGGTRFVNQNNSLSTMNFPKPRLIQWAGLLALGWGLALPLWGQVPTLETDVCVYGGTSGGVMAAYAAQKSGQRVLLIEPGMHLGGLSAGGLGQTDIGNKYAITGLARDFYRRLGRHYGQFEAWRFEPHAAEAVFGEYVREAGLRVIYNRRLVEVNRRGPEIAELVLEDSRAPNELTRLGIRAKVYIDCSYEGDLMAKAGVSYHVGREDNSVYQETLNGVQLMDKHQFPDGIDPYQVPGQPESGLLWGISPQPLAANGTGDRAVQAYNFRMCLSRDPANQVPITRPPGYDSTKYELLRRVIVAKGYQNLDHLLHIQPMPNQKTDINNNGAFSSDMIGMNHAYPEASHAEREKMIKAHEEYTKGLLYFLGHDPRLPQGVRAEMRQWGYPKDEYLDNGHWSHQIYVREARRMVGEYVMTEHNCTGRDQVADGVGLAAYTMDSHNCQRVVVPGPDGKPQVKNEGDVQVWGGPPYAIAYRALTPKRAECTNLLVPVCLSASHIAYGSIRMEPVFMVLGQSCGVAASLAIRAGVPVQQVDVAQLQAKLREDPLLDGKTPEIFIDNEFQAANVQVKGAWRSSFTPWLAGTPARERSFAKSSKVGTPNGTDALYCEDLKTKGQYVRFSPVIRQPGRYQVYVYVSYFRDPSLVRTTKLPVRVRHKGGVDSKLLDIGQVMGDWVAVGSYEFAAGTQGYAEIVPDGADGAVLADVVLFKPAF